ncbi:TRAP transporter small permease [Bordetella trematum]|uniref:TRAP transporter small permease n=1 Tax=Bordetella trematum TaxID=123899 RepID=UPI00345901CF
MKIKKTGAVLGRCMDKVENTVILTSYVTLIALVGVETLRRALFQQQATWGPEVAMYAFIWLSWFAMAKHCRYGTNLAFLQFREAMPAWGRRTLEVMDMTLWLTIGGVILYTTSAIIERNLASEQTIFGTSIPLAWANLAVPLGWGFSMVRIAQRLFLVLFDWDQLEEERRNQAAPAA